MKNSPHIEPLEARIAPAAIVVTYQDIDGDTVKITDSSGHLSVGNLTAAGLSGGANFQLGRLDLRNEDFTGANITFTVTKAAGGDGLAAVGYIDATGIDLGDVKVLGDLGSIDAGSGSSTLPALKSLTVNSLGLYGTATGAPDLSSNLKGSLGALTVTTDVKDASVFVSNGNAASAKIGAVKIGGSLVGGLADNSGEIFAYGGIGAVTIGGNLVGAGGVSSGLILTSTGEIGSVTVGGSLLGGSGLSSGGIFNLNGGIGAVKIGGNIHGDIGAESGKIAVKTNIVSLTVGGSIVGGSGSEADDANSNIRDGQIYAGGNIGSVTIAHDLHGGTGASSAKIRAVDTIGDVSIGGSVIGVGPNSGSIRGSQGMGVIKIGHDVKGGAAGSGTVTSDAPVVSITVGGSVIGGDGGGSGLVTGGVVTIGHDLLGGLGAGSGIVDGGNNFSVTIGGSLVGGRGDGSGGITASNSLVAVKIGRDLIGGSISPGQTSLNSSGFILASQRIGSIEIGGSIISGLDNSSSGSLLNNASIRAGQDIGSITVKGDIAGNQLGNDISSVVITAAGQATPGATGDVAIGRITVGHRVEQLKVLAGYQGVTAGAASGPTAVNADAQIGTVTVGGDWIASDLVAGVKNVSLQSFGDANDAKITGGTDDPNRTSKIGSITITGRALGAPTSAGGAPDTRHFGFVAESIGALKILGTTFALNPAQAEGRKIGGLTELAYHELGGSLGTPSIAGPHTLVPGGKVLTYNDLDGDRVTVTFSQSLLTAANLDNVFKFYNGPGVIGSTDFISQLQEIDLAGLAADGLNITITVKKGIYGDGLADVGYIHAPNLNLGAVTIAGDLGQIDAGRSDGVALKSLKVRSLGRLGITSQPASSGGFFPDLVSSIQGSLGALTVTADVKDTEINASTTAFTSTIGPVTIGGSLLGGKILSDTNIGTVKIGGSIAGGNFGGGISGSGGKVTSVTVGGSVLGGGVQSSGQIFAGSDLGAVAVAGNLVGGTTANSGYINAGTSFGNVKVGGSLLGTAFDGTATIIGPDTGTITIGHNILGSAGLRSGSIDLSSAKGVTVGGSLIGGGTNQLAGSISTSDGLGALKIGQNIFGGAVGLTGYVSAYTITGISIGGSLVGDGTFSGSIITLSTIGAVKIGHDVTGGGGVGSGYIKNNNGDQIKSVTIGGSLLGGTANTSGSIFASGALGAVKIGRDVEGGSITGSGAGFQASGSILAGSRLGAVTIGGSLIAGLDHSTGGSLTASGTVRAGDDLASLTVTGSLLGRATANGSTAVIVSAGTLQRATATSDLVIGKVRIGGLVNLANLQAGYNPDLLAIDKNAQIGAVMVKGNWLASNLIAGAENTGANNASGGGDDNLNFGDSHDQIIGGPSISLSIAKIASITIGGSVAGTPGNVNGSDHFGFVAHTIGSFKSAGYTAPLKTATLAELIPLTVGTNDVAIHEV